MEAKVIAKQDISAWLSSLAEKMEVLAPVEDGGVIRYRPLGEGEMNLNFSGPAKSLRDHFTPETETLFRYKYEGLKAELEESPAEEHDRLIFGARACDAAALKYVDAVYSMVEPRDEPYFARRERTTIVGLFCNNPAWSCFCTEVGNFLTNPQEMDAGLTDIGDKYYAEAYTAKGEELLSAAQFEPAGAEDAAAVEKVKQKALSRLPAKGAHEEACLSYNWDSPIFPELAEKCLGCGVCAYSCPTCHCFDIQECAQGKKGSRFRCWDTCQFEKFTLMGHGHNPRPSKKERTRQRVFHKFKYSIERYKMLGCVGCGRCISACPVNIDIHAVVAELEKPAPASEGVNNE
ncbi:MAG: 4Fe-4S dicluster domain-containing protein [Armatimonadota bacterium]